MSNDNQRIKLTKTLLKDAMIQLLKTKTIYDLSIIEICKTAEINRSTFYNHYGNQYDLLKEMENETFEVANGFLDKLVLADEEDSKAYLISLLDYIEKNHELFILLLNNNVDNTFSEKLGKLVTSQMLRNISIESMESAMKEYSIIYVYEGCVSIVLHWINKKNREETEKIASIIMDLAFKTVTKKTNKPI